MSIEAAARSATDVAAIQKRSVRSLSAGAVAGGIAVAGAIPAGALIAASLASEAVAGLAQTTGVIGAAVLALPLARIALSRGRRAALSLGYGLGAFGAVIVVVAGASRSLPLVFVGCFFVGVASAAGLQARYAATDLAEASHRGRALAIVVWAGTVGAVLGPNLLELSGSAAVALGLPQLTGPYLTAALMLVIAVTVLQLALRPDPYLLARSLAAEASGVELPKASLRDGLEHLRMHRRAVLGVSSVALGHVVMVMVMVMTPVHMSHVDVSLQLIGLVISVHVLGMYAFSPVVGWLVDRFGRVPMILVGAAILLVACVVSGLAPSDSVPVLAVGLFLLGLGWSFTLIAGFDAGQRRRRGEREAVGAGAVRPLHEPRGRGGRGHRGIHRRRRFVRRPVRCRGRPRGGARRTRREPGDAAPCRTSPVTAIPLGVPVGATAARPEWASLPGGVRAAIESLAGSAVLEAVSQGGGFTSGFASRLLLADGSRVFVKAASSLQSPVAHPSYLTEASVVAALPAAVPAPRLVWRAEVDDWVLLGFEDVESSAPARPWQRDELDRVLDVLTHLAAALTPVPESLAHVGSLHDYDDEMSFWRKRAAGDPEMLALPLPDAWEVRVGAVAALEAGWTTAADGETATHFDLRDDNVLLTPSGGVLVCDWNWLTRGAAWLDLAALLVSVHGDGLDADAIWASHPLAAGVPGRALDAFLAALSGLFVVNAAASSDARSPWLRAHQAWWRDASLRWLDERLAVRS